MKVGYKQMIKEQHSLSKGFHEIAKVVNDEIDNQGLSPLDAIVILSMLIQKVTSDYQDSVN